jgi:hypothetical protein
LCLLNLVNACLPYLFHSSISLPFFHPFGVSPRVCEVKIGELERGCFTGEVAISSRISVDALFGFVQKWGAHGCPKIQWSIIMSIKKNGYLGYPMSEQMHNGYYFGGCAILSWIFLTVLGPPIHWPGALQLWIDINRRAWKWAAQGVRGRCLTCWERAVDRAMFELLEELTSWISACSPSGLRLPRLEVLGN